MEATTILLDTSIVIDFFRKREKSKSILFQLTGQYRFSISVITAFEIKIGIQTPVQQNDYDTLVQNLEVLPIDHACIDEAAAIYKELKPKNALIELADLLIGATAVSNTLPLATLNRKHFERIPNLTLVNLPENE
ncbi:type II toxin-antitoxin system VapC family toxin [bacterium]|nr:type II toxin-antitoxin system VapC family toxin [bacterium]